MCSLDRPAAVDFCLLSASTGSEAHGPTNTATTAGLGVRRRCRKQLGLFRRLLRRLLRGAALLKLVLQIQLLLNDSLDGLLGLLLLSLCCLRARCRRLRKLRSLTHRTAWQDGHVLQWADDRT